MKENDNFFEIFSLENPVGDALYEDPYELFSGDGNAFLEGAITEATSGTNKGNIFQRLWNFIKKIFKWIRDHLRKAWNWIKGLFKKKTKTADQILVDTGIGIGYGATNNKSTNSDNRISIEIESNPRSTTDMPKSIDVYFKPFITKILKDGVMFSWSSTERNINYKGLNRTGAIVGHKAVFRGNKIQDWRLVIVILYGGKDAMNKLKRTLELIGSKNFNYKDFCRGTNSVFESLDRTVDAFNKYEQTFTMDNLMAFQKDLDDIVKIMEKFDSPYSSKIEDYKSNKAFIASLNDLSGLVSRMQMGVNAVTSAFKEVWMVDAAFQGSIKDVKTLDEFVSKCIENNVPPKYINYNCYILSSDDIKGNKGTADKPIWGQSRTVFFPTGKQVVYKIALSTFGTRSNLAEQKLSRTFNKIGRGDLLALVTDMARNNCVVSQEKVDTDAKKPSDSDVRNLKKELNDVISKNNMYLDAIYDLHKGNVGIKNKKWVAIDFGMLRRSSTPGVTSV